MSASFNLQVIHFIFRGEGVFFGVKNFSNSTFLLFLSSGIHEKVVQKWFNCFLVVSWPYMSAWFDFGSYTSFLGVARGGGWSKLLLIPHFFDFWAPEYVKKWSKNDQILLGCFMTIHECLVQFSNRTLHFEGWRGVCGVCGAKTAVIPRFSISEHRNTWNSAPKMLTVF